MNSFIRDGVCSRRKRNGGLSWKRRIPTRPRIFSRIILVSSDDDDDTNDTAVAADTSAVVNRSENEDLGITSVLNKGDQDPSNEQTEQNNIESSNNVDAEDLSSCVKNHEVDKNKGKHIAFECWKNVTDGNEDLENHIKGRDLEKERIFELCYLNANFNMDKCISMVEQIGKKSYVHLEKIDIKRTKLIQSPCKEVKKVTKPKMKRSYKLNCRIDKKILKLFGKKYFESDKILMINELNNLKMKPNNNYFASRITNFTDDNGSLSDISLNDTSLGKIGEVFSLQLPNDSVEKDESPVSHVVEVHVNSTESHISEISGNKTLSGNISDVYSLQLSNDTTEKNENPMGPAVEVHDNSNMKTSESHLSSEQTSLYTNEICIEDLQDSNKLTPRNDKIEVINSPLHNNLIINDDEEVHVDKKENTNSNDYETLKIKMCTIIHLDDEVFSHRIVNDLALYLMQDDHLSNVDKLWATPLSCLTSDLIIKLIEKFNSTKYNMAYLSGCLVCVFRVIEESSTSLPNEIKKKITLFINVIRKYVKHIDNLMWRKWLVSTLFSDWFVFLSNVFIPNKNILTVDDKSLVKNAMKYLKKIKHVKYRFKNKTIDGVVQSFNNVDSYSTDTNKVNNIATEETKLENHETKNHANIVEKDNLNRISEPKIAKLTLKKVHSAEAKNQIQYVNVLENTNTLHKPTKKKKRKYEKKQCLNEEIQQPFKKPLMIENQNNKHKLEENNEHTTKKKKLNHNRSNVEKNNRKTVIENNINVLDKSLTTKHLQLKQNCSTASKNQIECENVCSVPENVVKLKVLSQFNISNTFKNPTFGIKSELLLELLKNNNDNTIQNNCSESTSPTISNTIIENIMNENNIVNSGENNPEIIQTVDKNIRKKKHSKQQKESLSPPEAYYQVGNNPQKFGLTCDTVVSNNLSRYYNNISASNLNSSHISIIPTNISSTEDSNNVNSQPSTAINTYSYSAINTQSSTAINTQSSTALNTQASTAINTLPSVAEITQSCSITTQPSNKTYTWPSSTTTTQPFSSMNTHFYSNIKIPSYSATNTRSNGYSGSNDQPYNVTNARPSSTTSTQPSISMNTQLSTAINTLPSVADITQSCSITNTRPSSKTNTQPSSTSTTTTQPFSSMNTHFYSNIKIPSYSATNTRSNGYSGSNDQPYSVTNARPSSTTSTQPSSSMNTQLSSTMNIQPYSSMNIQPFSSMNTLSSSAPNAESYSATNTQLYGTNGTMNIQPNSAASTLSSSVPNAQSYSATNTQSLNASTTEPYRRFTNLSYNNTMNFNIMQYNYNTQLPPNNQTNSNQSSSDYCNVHCNSSHNSFAYANGNNSSLNYNRNQNDSSFVNPLSGYSNLTVHPVPKPASNSVLSNATSARSSVMNTATLDQNVCNYNYNYNPNQMSTGSYHPHAETAQEKSELPTDYNDKVSPGLPDGRTQNTPNQANCVTMYTQN